MEETFDEELYLRANPDVAAAVRAGLIESGLAHYDSHGRAEGRLLRPLEFGTLPFLLDDFDTVINEVHRRIEDYRARGVDHRISPLDDMFRSEFLNPERAYIEGGESAIQVIAGALILARRSSVETVLDLASGAGRVTRHLRAFFPEARIAVYDINRPLAEFAASTFDAELLDLRPDFSEPPARQFDLVFVGSLLTHLPQPSFKQALEWLIAATAPGGLLVVTLHGRHFDSVAGLLAMRPEQWQEVRANWQQTSFGYMETGEYETPYGLNITNPSWVLHLVEADPGVRVLAYEEQGWAETQDVLVLKRL